MSKKQIKGVKKGCEEKRELRLCKNYEGDYKDEE